FLDELLKLLSIFDIDIAFTDDHYGYKTHITDSTVITGKRITVHLGVRSGVHTRSHGNTCFDTSPYISLILESSISFAVYGAPSPYHVQAGVRAAVIANLSTSNDDYRRALVSGQSASGRRCRRAATGVCPATRLLKCG
ncbi:MAG: hypothetical protein LBB94_13055, partial [Clostridiales bacterium]|nr:hypothetical protein [Clostridiales bacterium]